jgi:hypothetical protein
MDPHSLQPPARCRRRREGDQRWWTAEAAAAAALGGVALESPSPTQQDPASEPIVEILWTEDFNGARGKKLIWLMETKSHQSLHAFMKH